MSIHRLRLWTNIEIPGEPNVFAGWSGLAAICRLLTANMIQWRVLYRRLPNIKPALLICCKSTNLFSSLSNQQNLYACFSMLAHCPQRCPAILSLPWETSWLSTWLGRLTPYGVDCDKNEIPLEYNWIPRVWVNYGSIREELPLPVKR